LDTDLHEYTFGITSDALSQLAVAFSALIRSVDHRGVPNFQLPRKSRSLEKSTRVLPSKFHCLELLMDPHQKISDNVFFTNVQDVKRFRQYVVNSSIATDIFDKDINVPNTLEEAFDEGSMCSFSKRSDGGSSQAKKDRT
jgi:hypothetical protein